MEGLTKAFDIYEQAENLVRQADTRNPDDIANYLNVDMYFHEFDKLLGMYTRIFDQRVIIINSQLSEELYRMVLGHELGHDILHSNGAVQSSSGIADFKEFSMTCKAGTLEYEANAFCAHLLIPNEDFLESVYGGDTVEAMAAKFCVDPNLILIKGKELCKMGYNIRNCDNYNSRFLDKY